MPTLRQLFTLATRRCLRFVTLHMFESELERVRKQLKQQLASQQPYVTLDDILANEQVHPAFRAYFRAEVNWWVYEERAIRNSNPRFATGDVAFRDVFKAIDELFVKHARFDHEELNATIEAAAKTRLNFLCRPRVTLRWFVYRGEPTKPLHEILLRLGYLQDHRYLVEGFEQWAKSRGTDSSAYEILSVIEFERIIEKLDNDAILEMSQSQFVALLEPLFLFFAAYNPDLPPESIPTESVIIFLDDKGAVPISQALERLLYREEVKFLTRSKLIDVIEEVLTALDGSEPHLSAATKTVEDVVVTAAVPNVIEETIDTPALELVELADDGLALRHSKLAQLIDDRMRDKVVKRVFAKDEALYHSIVDVLLASASWKEAAGYLDRFFAERGIEPNSAVAMEFAQAIHRSFLRE